MCALPDLNSDDGENGMEIDESGGEEAPANGAKKAKAKKDPNAPKKSMSSYMLWANASRDKVKVRCTVPCCPLIYIF